MMARQAAVVILIAVVGCKRTEDRRIFSSVDSWYSPPPVGVQFTQLSKDRFAVVADALQPEAQAALSEVAAKRVSADEAARLVGKQIPAVGEFILLRAVVLNEGTGAFEVGMSGQSVSILHGCLGRHSVPTRSKALGCASVIARSCVHQLSNGGVRRDSG
jgi:hypothetical protein